LQIETEAGSDEEFDESDSEVNGEIELSKVNEMRIIPSDPGQLDKLFEAFSHCAELNPDPNAASDEENGWVHGDEGDEDMTDGSDAEFSDVNPIGQTDDHNITHVVVELQIDDQRFQDAEEADEESHRNGH